MKIAVMSPGRQFGASMISILLSISLSNKMGRTVLLSALDPDDWTHQAYLTLPESKEITKSLRQVNAMLNAGAIDGDTVKRYGNKRGERLYVLNPVVENISKSDLTQIVEYICQEVSEDIVIVDANVELGSEEMDRIIDCVDYFVIVLSQSIACEKKFAIWKEESKSFEEMEEKGITYVINKYDNRVSGIRDLVRRLEIPKSRTVSIPENFRLSVLSNQGTLHEVEEYFDDCDIRLINVQNSVETLVDKIILDVGLETEG